MPGAGQPTGSGPLASPSDARKEEISARCRASSAPTPMSFPSARALTFAPPLPLPPRTRAARQLRVDSYVVAAFDAIALAECRRRGLPCFDAANLSALGIDAPAARPAAPPAADGNGSALEYGSAGFQALTKLKSAQVRHPPLFMQTPSRRGSAGTNLP